MIPSQNKNVQNEDEQDVEADLNKSGEIKKEKEEIA